MLDTRKCKLSWGFNICRDNKSSQVLIQYKIGLKHVSTLFLENKLKSSAWMGDVDLLIVYSLS